ncbi:MAG: ATP-binding protein [Syntrophobacter sp.]
MNGSYSFRTRMILTFWIMLLAALLLPPWYYFRSLASQVLEESRENAIQQLDFVQWTLHREKQIPSAEDLNRLLVEIGDKLSVRLSYIAEGGKVIADSQVPFSEIPNLENHAARPEIIQSLSQEIGSSLRFSGTAGRDLMYMARRITGIAGIPPGVLRVAAPLSKMKEPVDRLKVSFLIFLGIFFIAIAAISYLLIRRLNNPIRALIETAEAISSRDYARRIRISPGHEFHPLTQAINRMADSIQVQIKTVTEQKQELEAVFNAMQECVMVLDSGGRIIRVNQTFARLSSGDDVIGRRPLEVISNPELQKISDDTIKATAGDTLAQPHNFQIVLGDERTYDVNIVGLPDQKKGRGAVAVFHEITELKRLEKVRQDFVANVSHELRTPLTSIKGYTETLLSEKKPDRETSQAFLQVILKNTNHMVKMVEDLLQLARLEAHQLPSKLISVNAASALLTAWRSCRHHAEGKNIQLESLLPPDGVLVSADFDQLVQVFRNLLENSIRYSPSDHPITAFCTLGSGEVTFAIRDEGPGISKKHHQRIFERFYRVEKHRGDQGGSTGLGLAICRHILLHHNGRIWVQSPNEGSTKGATFFFTLKKAPASSVTQSHS